MESDRRVPFLTVNQVHYELVLQHCLCLQEPKDYLSCFYSFKRTPRFQLGSCPTSEEQRYQDLSFRCQRLLPQRHWYRRQVRYFARAQQAWRTGWSDFWYGAMLKNDLGLTINSVSSSGPVSKAQLKSGPLSEPRRRLIYARLRAVVVQPTLNALPLAGTQKKHQPQNRKSGQPRLPNYERGAMR
jgi:hypothetical protein